LLTTIVVAALTTLRARVIARCENPPTRHGVLLFKWIGADCDNALSRCREFQRVRRPPLAAAVPNSIESEMRR
jgi:hypothetical protein